MEQISPIVTPVSFLTIVHHGEYLEMMISWDTLGSVAGWSLPCTPLSGVRLFVGEPAADMFNEIKIGRVIPTSNKMELDLSVRNFPLKYRVELKFGIEQVQIRLRENGTIYRPSLRTLHPITNEYQRTRRSPRPYVNDFVHGQESEIDEAYKGKEMIGYARFP